MFSSYQKKNILLKHNCYHVAIIMDGNGRWAKKKGRIRSFGHKAGLRSVRRAISFCINHGIHVLTLYAFSSENWDRPIQEVNELMNLFVWALDNEIKNLNHYNIRLHIIGERSRFDINLQDRIQKAETITKKNTGLILVIAVNYSGRWDIVRSTKRLAKKVQKGMIKVDQINEETFNKYICMNKMIPVDLVIRTGGEYRISNFLLWQIAYSELYFTNVLWPDFNNQDFENALCTFSNRERRFGKIKLENK